MNTTTAAIEAHVTVATIRTWARRGIIAATKTAGRWIIDAASLARRIAIGAMKRPAKPATVELTPELLVAVGGNRWQKNGMDRIYFNNPAQLAGLETEHYKSGNICWAAYQGERISNSQGHQLAGCIDKLWFDVTDGRFYTRRGWSESNVATRSEVADAAIAAIRTAAAEAAAATR